MSRAREILAEIAPELEADGEIDWITLDEKAKTLVTQALTEATA